MIRETLVHVANHYLEAKTQPNAKHPMASYLRDTAPKLIRNALGTDYFESGGSSGQGVWTHVPWISVFDPTVTDSAQHGFYIVYLFASDMEHVFLSLNQGATEAKSEFGPDARNELKRKAALMRARIPEYAKRFPLQEIDLGPISGIPKLYEPGHAMGVAYTIAALPSEDVLVRQLRDLTQGYRALAYRGGTSALETLPFEESASSQSVIEQKRYTYHRAIERDSKGAKLAKKALGWICQVCDFNFAKAYGALGSGYIEAHHLTPLSTLKEGEAVSLDPQTDFAVVCANCHRMLHRKDAPALTSIRDLPSVRGLRAKW